MNLRPTEFAVVESVRAAIGRYRMLAAGDAVVVAVSGGPDSVCLLDALARSRLDLQLVVAHVDHGLSEASEEIAARVSRTAATAGYDVHVVRAPDLEGANLHARARDFRYEFFDIVATRVGAARIATGHTLDDRVETTLARLIHGGGTDVLAGLAPADGARIRPLVDLRRGETRAYCEALGLEFYDDPANDDERFERPAVRRRIVAAVEDRWGEGAIRAIAQSADRLHEDSQALNALVDRIYDDLATEENGSVFFDRDPIVLLARAFRRRILERAVGRIRDRAAGIDDVLDHLDRHQDGEREEKRFAIVGGTEIILGSDRITVSRMPG